MLKDLSESEGGRSWGNKCTSVEAWENGRTEGPPNLRSASSFCRLPQFRWLRLSEGHSLPHPTTLDRANCTPCTTNSLKVMTCWSFFLTSLVKHCPPHLRRKRPPSPLQRIHGELLQLIRRRPGEEDGYRSSHWNVRRNRFSDPLSRVSLSNTECLQLN